VEPCRQGGARLGRDALPLERRADDPSDPGVVGADRRLDVSDRTSVCAPALVVSGNCRSESGWFKEPVTIV
jgi:hypothetical protein